MNSNEKRTPQSRTYTMNDIAVILGIDRSSIYKLTNSILFKKIRISKKSFQNWPKMGGLDEMKQNVDRLYSKGFIDAMCYVEPLISVAYSYTM